MTAIVTGIPASRQQFIIRMLDQYALDINDATRVSERRLGQVALSVATSLMSLSLEELRFAWRYCNRQTKQRGAVPLSHIIREFRAWRHLRELVTETGKQAR